MKLVMENKNIIEVDEQSFVEKVIDASENSLVLVDFWAPWCGPCKQLTPVLEKIIKNASDKVSLVKINIDENQQIAGQLRIQSIPTVFAFKNKQIVNAFQGVIPEKQIIEFIEKCLDSKLNNDFTEFYQTIENLMSESKYEESKDLLLDFISNNSQEILAIKFYLECLIELKHFKEVDSFIESLEKEVQNKDEIKKIIKKVEIIKNNLDGPTVEELIKKIEKQPKDINLILELANKYFSIQKYEDSMELLLSNYPKNKAIIKEKMVEYFNVLGDTNEYTVSYRKKLSQIMFS